MQLLRSLKPDPRSRPKPFTFYPPKSNPLVIAIAKAFSPSQLRKKLKVVEVEIDDEDLDKLRALKNKRCLLMPTHSGGFEPYVVIYLSKVLDRKTAV